MKKINKKEDSSLNILNIQYLAKNKVIGFFDFIRTQGVIGLAIGFMLGDKIKNLVNSLVNDILNPLLMVITGNTGALVDAKVRFFGADLFWGRFTANLIDFIVMATIIYLIYKVLRLDRLDNKSES